MKKKKLNTKNRLQQLDRFMLLQFLTVRLQSTRVKIVSTVRLVANHYDNANLKKKHKSQVVN